MKVFCLTWPPPLGGTEPSGHAFTGLRSWRSPCCPGQNVMAMWTLRWMLCYSSWMLWCFLSTRPSDRVAFQLGHRFCLWQQPNRSQSFLPKTAIRYLAEFALTVKSVFIRLHQFPPPCNRNIIRGTLSPSPECRVAPEELCSGATAVDNVDTATQTLLGIPETFVLWNSYQRMFAIAR